jgi:hypothetical protein
MRVIKVPHIRILLVLLVLVSASLACNLPGSRFSRPPTAAPFSTQEVQQFEDQMEATLSNLDASGPVTLTVTQEQINAYMVARLAEQEEPIFTDPVVVLTAGQIEIYGKVAQSGLSIPAKMVLEPRVDNGSPRLDLVSFDLGGLPVPEPLKERASNMIDDALVEYLAQTNNVFQVNDITISEGQMTISGERLP